MMILELREHSTYHVSFPSSRWLNIFVRVMLPIVDMVFDQNLSFVAVSRICRDSVNKGSRTARMA